MNTLLITADRVIAGPADRVTADCTPIGQLRRHPAHRINEAHIRYHRALCGRDHE
ncbi:hypothetical protein [Streptomyces sp. NPDC003857]